MANSDPADAANLALFLSAPLTLDSVNFNKDLKEVKWCDLDMSTLMRLAEYNEEMKADPSAYWYSLHLIKFNVPNNIALGC
jgi:hypothetical protein